MAAVVAKKYRRARASQPVMTDMDRQEAADSQRLDELFRRWDESTSGKLSFDQLRAVLQELLNDSAVGACSQNTCTGSRCCTADVALQCTVASVSQNAQRNWRALVCSRRIDGGRPAGARDLWCRSQLRAVHGLCRWRQGTRGLERA